MGWLFRDAGSSDLGDTFAAIVLATMAAGVGAAAAGVGGAGAAGAAEGAGGGGLMGGAGGGMTGGLADSSATGMEAAGGGLMGGGDYTGPSTQQFMQYGNQSNAINKQFGMDPQTNLQKMMDPKAGQAFTAKLIQDMDKRKGQEGRKQVPPMEFPTHGRTTNLLGRPKDPEKEWFATLFGSEA